MRTADTFEAVRSASSRRVVALVPTMGYLHEGHASLVALAHERAEMVVMSIFVNPLQFDDQSDLERYPRDADRDAAIAEEAGVDVLFTPDAEEMYPLEPLTRVIVRGVTEEMEGAQRPGHFEGVATVVAKLFAGIQPAIAVFGRKDAQQLAVVRRMTIDLSFPVEVVGAPTIRDPDGLAVSSRNVFLTERARSGALSLSAGLSEAVAAVKAGVRDADALEGIVIDRVRHAGAAVEYVVLADALSAQRIETLDRESFLAVAARVAGVRLIDNVFLWPDGTADTGVRLETPSILREV